MKEVAVRGMEFDNVKPSLEGPLRCTSEVVLDATNSLKVESERGSTMLTEGNRRRRQDLFPSSVSFLHEMWLLPGRGHAALPSSVRKLTACSGPLSMNE